MHTAPFSVMAARSRRVLKARELTVVHALQKVDKRWKTSRIVEEEVCSQVLFTCPFSTGSIHM